MSACARLASAVAAEHGEHRACRRLEAGIDKDLLPIQQDGEPRNVKHEGLSG
jgi:hypothetical protein